ncbi:hypothetical protein AB834_04875 [PVC group bacterium (ex Bugula neritina AB1)]|nr:hypothetical protein AB834_04875 [PVC group bacterium (ex Bugula neritina AB1)]
MFLLIFSLHSNLWSSINTGDKAHDFSLKDPHGKEYHLSDYLGQTVVLEWVNYDCPFVKKHYKSGHMQHLQGLFRKKGVIWFSINSSAPTKQGHFESNALLKRIEKEEAIPSAYLLDTNGKIGHLYGAKTTPHIFIINKKGRLIYQGAVDDNPSVWGGKDPHEATNFIRVVLTATEKGRPSPIKKTKAYGCSIKY